MSLYLTEFILPPEAERDARIAAIDETAGRAGGELIELQAGADSGRLYAIVEHGDRAALETAFRESSLSPIEVVEVRLVGPTLKELRVARGNAGYLVEWDIADDHTMESYLEHKKSNAPLHALVPETTFLRTYVREDLVKCLSFYRAPDEDAVLRTREAVNTPVSRIGRVIEAPRPVAATVPVKDSAPTTVLGSLQVSSLQA